MTHAPQETADIAERFVSARRAAASLPDFPGVVPASLQAAYRIQDVAIARRGSPIGGWKVGRILAPLAERYGADRLAGPIFVDTIVHAVPGSACTGCVFDGGFGAAEAEYLLRLGAAPPAGQQQFSLAQAAALIDRVHVGIEIASSPFAGINDLGPAVTIADFGNNNGLIVGPEIPSWQQSGFADWDVSLSLDGVHSGAGRAATMPDGPFGSVRFLLENLAQRGQTVRAGTWISTGAITGVHTVRPGQLALARFGTALQVSCSFVSQAAPTD